MRIIAISDTHTQHEKVVVPDGDVLVHAGDFCSRGRIQEATAFLRWFDAQPHKHKVFIAGNHDLCFEQDPNTCAELLRLIHPDLSYLRDSAIEIDGVKFYGSPFQPAFMDWAFQLPHGEMLERKWSYIPDDTDVLITHGPRRSMLDRTYRGDLAGCEELGKRIDQIKPKVHIFGHIHEGYGMERYGATRYYNASSCTLQYVPNNPAMVIDL